MANYTNPYNPYSSQPMFPQPNGNVYLISSSLEVANIPTGAGITAALCLSENLLYLKTMQNGMPAFMTYHISPHVDNNKPQENDIEKRLLNIEKQLSNLISGGKDNNEESTADWH